MMNAIKDAATSVGETVLAAKAAATEVRRATAEKIGQAGTGSSDALHAAALAVDDLAERTEQRFASASRFVENCDAGTMLQDLRRVVRRHPGSFLLAAAAVAATLGYAAGSANKPSRLGD